MVPQANRPARRPPIPCLQSSLLRARNLATDNVKLAWGQTAAPDGSNAGAEVDGRVVRIGRVEGRRGCVSGAGSSLAAWRAGLERLAGRGKEGETSEDVVREL